MIPRNMLPPRHPEKAKAAKAYLLRGVGRDLRKNELVRLGAMAGSALVERLERMKIPVTPGTVLRSLDHVASAVDDAFPG
jgi:hypothetical protein